MRLLKLGVYYPIYLEQFFARYPALATQNYEIQHTALINDCFGSSDFWTSALRNFGYETCDLIANAESLQRAWAHEHKLSFNEDNWLFDITAAQIKAFAPDVLIVADYSTITATFIKQLRHECPSLRLVLGWCGAPYSDGAIFAECDVVLSCVPELVAHFVSVGHCSRHINHAFDPRILKRIDLNASPATDFVFVGSVIKTHNFHVEREQILERLLQETALQIFSSVSLNKPSARSSLAQRARRFLSGRTDTNSLIAARAQFPLFGLEMFQRLHDSRVALNTHIDISIESASNMRLFEATGVGACLLTDWKQNLGELFEPDVEIVTYRSVSECIEKVNYLLDHEEERQRIASAGQRRTRRDHNFDVRAAQIDEIIREALSSHP